MPQRWIAESAYRAEQDLASGERPKVGVNVYADTGPARRAAPLGRSRWTRMAGGGRSRGPGPGSPPGTRAAHRRAAPAGR